MPVILFDFGGWTQNAVRLWPENNTQRENFLLLDRTPLSTPSVRSISLDSGCDTVFQLSKKMIYGYRFDDLSVVELLQNIADHLHVLKREPYFYCNFTLENYLKWNIDGLYLK